jgi:hypothetical protein
MKIYKKSFRPVVIEINNKKEFEQLKSVFQVLLEGKVLWEFLDAKISLSQDEKKEIVHFVENLLSYLEQIEKSLETATVVYEI